MKFKILIEVYSVDNTQLFQYEKKFAYLGIIIKMQVSFIHSVS